MDIQNLFQVKDKVVLVTGGSKGVGLMIAEGFVTNGANVYICSRTETACKQTCDYLNQKGSGKCEYIVADLSSLQGVDKVVEFLKGNENRLDVLVNNSGAVHVAAFADWDEKSYDQILNLNLKAIFFLSQKLLPLLKVAASKESPTHIINIGSINGLTTNTLNAVPYDASKAAVHHMSKVMGAVLSEHHINVNAIALGLFKSDMTKDLIANGKGAIEKAILLGRAGFPEEIAGTCLFLASKAGGYITGTTISVDGGSITGMKPAF